MARKNQKDRILKYMQDFGSITQSDAFTDLGVARLASRINDMKKDGIKIKTVIEHGTNRYNEPTRYARYSLVKEK